MAAPQGTNGSRAIHLGTTKQVGRDDFLDNLRKSERIALKQLQRDDTLVIRDADKGSCLVVEDRHVYVQDGLNHLGDGKVYETLEEDPTRNLVKGINGYITNITKKGYIPQDVADYLIRNPDDVRTQQMYFLKKIHKGPHVVRPIVSGTEGPTERLSAYLDNLLKPLAPKTSSYVRDSTHVINTLEELKPTTDCLLASIDVKSLYTNIPNEEGALHHLFELNEDKDDIVTPPSIIEEMMKIVLKQNIFEFDNKIYQQIRGTAMGTRMAPTFANLFMAEKMHNQFEILMDTLNTAHPTIKFTWTLSEKEVTFLDLEVYKGERFEKEGILDIRPHFKATNRFQYLHYASSHPRATYRGIVKGEMKRILRAVTKRPSKRTASY